MGNIYTPSPQIKNFMEFEVNSSEWHMWKLLSPSPSFNNVKESFRAYWLSLSLAKRHQIYYTLREQINNKIPIKEHPLFAIQDCKPCPTNWNGKEGINNMMKTNKMVIAKYAGSYGTYTAQEATIFEMTDVKPLN